MPLTADDGGLVEGYLATFGNEDKTKDVIHQGAFSATLAEAKAFAAQHHTKALYPLLWQHDQHDPIGGIMEAREDSHGLFVVCKLNRDCEHGRQAYAGLRGGYMSFSIGYKPIKYEWQGSVRHLTEVALGEGSAVTFPANREAQSDGGVASYSGHPAGNRPHRHEHDDEDKHAQRGFPRPAAEDCHTEDECAQSDR